MQQNFWVDPPVARGLKARPHHRQQACEPGRGVGSGIAVTDPSRPFAAIRISEIFAIAPSYKFQIQIPVSAAIFNHVSYIR